MTVSGNGWSSNPGHGFSSFQVRNGDYEFSQRGKATKTVIGLGILIALAFALSFFHPANHTASTSPPIVGDAAHSNSVSGTPGQATSPTLSAPAQTKN